MTRNDHAHLERCVALAEEAAGRGDAPFGSVLADAEGTMLREESNREATTGDATFHPEFVLAQWAGTNLTPDVRAGATVYTSGEHCPMCSAAHAWVGLGRIVYAASSAQLASWRESWGLPVAPVRALPVTDVAPGVETVGPVAPFDERMRAIHEAGLAQSR
ncbi:nucleoside deaminase [Cryptosporangium arvum]|uniref:nucleoside deaminase n=1 Tax=Cryptosporangium arvum TaxID=80871 RepID=UPI0004B9DB78|nr:nucleoside deaminase [Cryptosporangium arvum]